MTLHENVVACIACNLRNGCHRVVHGVGPHSSGGVMLVGEAPGVEEDLQGEPFVGGSGRLLTALLFANGFFRKQFYITNVVKCRPPGNRKPEPDEIATCKRWLVEEIRLFRPRLIVALGDTASLTLTGLPISHVGGVYPARREFGSLPTLICYHPAYVMRNRPLIPILGFDLCKIREPVTSYPPIYTSLARPIEFEVGAQQALGWVSVDIETHGSMSAPKDALNPFKAGLLGIGICTHPGRAFSLPYDEFSRSTIARFLASDTPKVFQNASFDLAVLTSLGFEVRNVIWDTMVAAHVLYSSAPADLDFLRARYTNIPPYKIVYKGSKRGGVEGMTRERLGEYNCYDVDVTLQTALAQQKSCNDKTEKLVRQGVQLTEIAVEMRLRGVQVDTKELGKFARSLAPEVARSRAEFENCYEVNPLSPKQLSKLLFETLKCPIPAIAKKGKTAHISVDEAVLNDLSKRRLSANAQDCIDKLLKVRESSQLYSTFIKGIAQRLHKQPSNIYTIHPEWKPTGAESGRWSCKNPNLQNAPKTFRSMFCARRGHKFVVGDYSQLEFRVALTLANDHETLRQSDGGLDIHEKTRLAMLEIVPTATRLLAKKVVFGTLYGLQPTTLARTLDIKKAEAEALQKVAITSFPSLVELKRQMLESFKNKHYAESFLGRKRYCETETQALNHPIQGTAIDITNSAMIQLRKAYGPIIVLQVHDEIVVEVPEHGDFSTSILQTIMEGSLPDLYPRFPASVWEAKTWGKED